MTKEEKARDIAETCGRPTYYGYHKIKDYSKEDCFHAAMEMAEWKECQMIEKAVKWIKSQMIPYGTSPLAIFNYIEEFKKAMKEE